ncbi:MAG: hypothetical protein AB7N80_08530 [Bdellovibrionales bacterium]
MRLFAFLFAAVITTEMVHAEEIQIFDMRKSLALSDQEPVYRDFYLSRGLEAGLRPGMILTVKRRQPLYDGIHNRSAGDLGLVVARIKIIHAEKGLAVARHHSGFNRDDLPLLEDNYIMIGDEVDLSSATTESKAKGQKKAEEKSEEVQPTADSQDSAEKPPQTAALNQNGVDFASQAPDNSLKAQPIDGPTVQ